MRTPQTIKLPSAEMTYRQNDEQVMRRTAEQAMENLRSDIHDNMTKSNTVGSLALRRFQFLLMGG
jgi:hypothetical protein